MNGNENANGCLLWLLVLTLLAIVGITVGPVAALVGLAAFLILVLIA